MRATPIAGAALAVLASACSSSAPEDTIVASIYPLAFAAGQLAAPEAEVIDLTPPGVEAHDVELTLKQRAQIQDAEMVIYLGDIGFQPQVERAVREADGTVIDLSDDLDVRAGVKDPHIWLDPSSFNTAVLEIADELCPVQTPCPEGPGRGDAFVGEVQDLGRAYLEGLTGCRYYTMIVPHEAFGYLGLYGIEQFGLAGLTPDAEPTASRLAQARRLVDEGEAAALFYEARGEDVGADMNLAADLGVPAFPLDTLESEPPSGDYLSVMEDNLGSLREGLQCR